MRLLKAGIRSWAASGGSALLLMLGAVPLTSSAAFAVCSIDGPSAVQISESFTLCGPRGSDITYEWHGPGVWGGTQTSCIRVNGLDAGTYEYELVTQSGGYAPERCVHTVRVGTGAAGSLECQITGPSSIAAGATAELCAPAANFHSYEWSGPGGFSARTRCVTVSAPGVYDVTIRNDLSGFVRQCSQRLSVAGDQGGVGDCAITGPSVIERGSSVELCGPRQGSASYRWTGPGGFSSSAPCITARQPGDYFLIVRNAYTGGSVRCSHRLEPAAADNGGGFDATVETNCPQAVGFWRTQCAGASGRSGGGLSDQDLRQIARRIDARSRYFNWSGDAQGLCQALRPARPLTNRKQVAEYFAALLANVVAGELNVQTFDGADISLDIDTPISFQGATTIGQLITMVDRMLLSSRGSYAGVAKYMRSICSGQGIGPVCE